MPTPSTQPLDMNIHPNDNVSSQKTLLHSFDLGPSKKVTMKSTQLKASILLTVFAVIAGIGTGYGGYKLQDSGSVVPQSGGEKIQQVAGDNVKEGDVFGIQDEKTFKDSAEGYLDVGGLDGEGSHRLLRVGGESQTVYLTSSVTDLDKLQGMEVKVWGETFKGQKAGWLMDVGRVQVLKLKGEAPTED